ncbi:hypothetical protein NDU88_003162 [Pleurodeles waltl]|uniref:Secreted protein n=1 Tax=Pleurodeles waltl TaxID=8319 RepID=A0AAV7NJY5_PLEWA|nr:hypothetical protein NDU88_003162 [Pleurodeles waltl]
MRPTRSSSLLLLMLALRTRKSSTYSPIREETGGHGGKTGVQKPQSWVFKCRRRSRERRGECIQVKTEWRGERIQVKTERRGERIQGKTEQRGECVPVKTEQRGGHVQVKSERRGEHLQEETEGGGIQEVVDPCVPIGDRRRVKSRTAGVPSSDRRRTCPPEANARSPLHFWRSVALPGACEWLRQGQGRGVHFMNKPPWAGKGAAL